MNKEQLIKKINDIVANEKFKLDAYFLCGFLQTNQMMN